jgi:hypothetical protein
MTTLNPSLARSGEIQEIFRHDFVPIFQFLLKKRRMIGP